MSRSVSRPEIKGSAVDSCSFSPIIKEESCVHDSLGVQPRLRELSFSYQGSIIGDSIVISDAKVEHSERI